MTLVELREHLANGDETVRAYLMGKVLRQAKPDDAMAFVRFEEIDALWPRVERYLGKRRAFWTWLLAEWRRMRGARE